MALKEISVGIRSMPAHVCEGEYPTKGEVHLPETSHSPSVQMKIQSKNLNCRTASNFLNLFILGLLGCIKQHQKETGRNAEDSLAKRKSNIK